MCSPLRITAVPAWREPVCVLAGVAPGTAVPENSGGKKEPFG